MIRRKDCHDIELVLFVMVFMESFQWKAAGVSLSDIGFSRQ